VGSDGTRDPEYLLERVALVSSSAVLQGNRCFGCGGDSSTGSGEHVIPRWLQRGFGLNDEKLQLLNGTLLPYRQLTIPCCSECNTTFLSQIEKQVSSLVVKGQAPDSTQRLYLARWLAKILIGILIKEAAIPHDRSNPQAGTIMPSSVLDHFRQAQLLIQTARKETKFSALHSEFPFTLYCYEILEDPRFAKFDLYTNVFGQSVAVRIGPIGAVFVNDGGLQHHVGLQGPFEMEGHCLHPIQFSEIAARIHYKAMLCDATHSYQTFETPSVVHVDQIDVVPFSKEILPDGSWRIFRPWDDRECASLVSKYHRKDFGQVYDEKAGAILTTLVDSDGRARAATDFI
jgi:hypothetical protein